MKTIRIDEQVWAALIQLALDQKRPFETPNAILRTALGIPDRSPEESPDADAK